MQLPLQIVFHGLSHSEAIETRIREKVAKLETFHPKIISCRVVVEHLRRHRHEDNRFNVRLDVHVPGHEIAVNRNHNEDVYVALRDAFAAAKRILEEEVELVRRAVKNHEHPLHGRIARLDVNNGHGYIETPAGDEVYFSRENVANPTFDQLEVGAEVQFLLEPGKNALLARRVSAGKHRFS